MLLPEKNAAQFLALYTPLLYYAGNARGVLPEDMTFKEFLDEPMEVKVDCRDAIYSPTPLFDDFLEDNGDQLSEKERGIVGAWSKRYVRGKFVLLQHLKEHSIFLSTDKSLKAYGVLGLTTELSEMAPRAYLPVFLETVLLPYEGVVVCDGLVMMSNILIGPNMTSNMKADYKRLKQSGKVITSLES